MQISRIRMFYFATLLTALLFLSGTRNLFAQAVASAVSLPADKVAAAANKPDSVNIKFDEKDPTIVIVEANGERFRVNSVTKLIERVERPAPSPSEPQPETAKELPKAQDKEDLYAYESGDEPYDYRLVNVPTPKKVPKGTWNLSFTHRFSQPLSPFNESAKALLGFDSMSSSAFGISYGITNKLYFSAYRSPICQKGLCRTIELGMGYHFTDQDKKSPLAVSAYASVEGNYNFSKDYTYNFQTMISRRIGKRVFLFFSPALHLRSNGNRRFNPVPEDYFPPADVALKYKLPSNTASFGMGASIRVRSNLNAIFEYTPRTGFKLGRSEPIFDSNFNVTGFKNISEPEMGIGVQYLLGKHSFTITLSNTQTTTTSRYNSSNLVLSPSHLIIGFNLFRRW